jgi:ABC-type uncharacterized transport system involved in gliding motility auxiliary subunit
MKGSVLPTVLSRSRNFIFYLLLAAAVAMAGWLGIRHHWVWDWSDRARNSLSEPSQQLLQLLEAPLKITSFAPENLALRQQIREIVERYQRYRPEIRLEFINPTRQPALTRELGIRVAGELRLEYRGRSENLQQLDEQHISNAIQRLVQRGERWIVTITGHGERRLTGQANFDLGGFGAELKRRGYRLQSQNLTSTPELPENTGLLLIAGPQTDYLPAEVALVLAYLKRGGNLLWLGDPGGSQGLEPLAQIIGVTRLPGTIVDANGAQLGLDDPSIALITRYPDHPAVRGFDLIALFPRAQGLEATAPEGWQAAIPLLTTLPRTWNETGPVQGEVTRDAALGEKAGPLTIGFALSRRESGREQRLLVIGDGDFLSNAFLGNGGNLELGLRLIRWLTGDDRLLEIPAKTGHDLSLNLSLTLGAVIGLGLLLVLPLLLTVTGLLIWWRRHRL